VLVPVREILDGRYEPSAGLNHSAHTAALQTIASWARDYLCNPHPDLGRSGDVCPWCPPSMDMGLFWLCTIQGAPDRDSWCEPTILELIEAFHAREPREGESTQFKTIVAIFPDLRTPETIAEIHARLKPFFLDSGLMLGEFFKGCSKSGIRNKAFRPLQSPVPLLVVREILEVDIVFLADRVEFVAAYLRKHRDRGRLAISRLLKHPRGAGLGAGELAILRKTLDANVPDMAPDGS
jgi:hypothetical protein